MSPRQERTLGALPTLVESGGDGRHLLRYDAGPDAAATRQVSAWHFSGKPWRARRQTITQPGWCGMFQQSFNSHHVQRAAPVLRGSHLNVSHEEQGSAPARVATPEQG